ncbi:PLP-dependent aminotransferase family protein [Acidipropionibacterium virtanenii]|uniref:2-aminoadipate transaminase n=1 Tax=Acidipropionibacterium virtanenii TaxID=2057246 RepID=A0A344UXT7_9ACTN|nr:2-aminoadipate transaminase [Acidipropionibacterium virtanenii]
MPKMDAAELSRMLGDWARPGRLLPDALAAGLLELIDAGFAPAGSVLPAQRDCAKALGVSRSTVASAFAELEARGYLASTVGSGTRVRSGRAAVATNGRLFSFTHSAPGVIDLSTGALPASEVARRELATGVSGLDDYLETDGYFPAGLPVLRQAIADRLTRDGIPTVPQQILITSGAQQATYLAMRTLVSPGDLAIVEDPTYRGGLEALRTLGARVQGVPLRSEGIDVDLLGHALVRRPAVLYCQTGIHNPTGTTMPRGTRAEVGELVNGAGTAVIEDCCSYDLTRGPGVARTLAGHVGDDLLVMIGSLSKLFWGGLRVGWARAGASRIRQILELRKAQDLATSVMSQLLATQLLRHAVEARRERRQMLASRLGSTQEVVREIFPGWRWEPIRGGTGLWIDTGGDVLALAEPAKRAKVRLAPGPSFSPQDGQRTMLRLPLWHDPQMLAEALGRI